MYAIIDRFEGNYAVLEMEDGTMADIKRNMIQGKAKEGDVLCLIEGRFIIDREETLRRKKEIKEISDGLWK